MQMHTCMQASSVQTQQVSRLFMYAACYVASLRVTSADQCAKRPLLPLSSQCGDDIHSGSSADGIIKALLGPPGLSRRQLGESQSKDLHSLRERTVRELIEPLTKILANTYLLQPGEPGIGICPIGCW